MIKTQIAAPSESLHQVLVCDGERHIARLIQVNLERLGWHVACAFNGEEAIEALKTQHFDRAIIAEEMPFVNGYQVLEWIRTNKETEHLWVAQIVAGVSAFSDWELREYQPNKFLTKPFNPSQIFD